MYSVASVREIDRAAIDAGNISGYTLMTRAGQFAFAVVRQKYPDATRWQVVCGSGNNGGDGYVIARLAMDAGISVSVVALTPVEDLQGDAATAAMDFAAAGGAVVEFTGSLDSSADLLIDALLGTGLTRDVTGAYKDVIEAMNLHVARVIAMDVPSGLNADTGQVMGCAVRAIDTATFVGQTPGLTVGDAAAYVGDVCFSDLDIPHAIRSREMPVMRRIDSDLLSQYLPPRSRTSHKGDFGHVLVVGGSPGMPGAVRICGEAALRAGAGVVTVATHPAHSQTICMERPELMCLGLDSEADINGLIEKADVIAIGPGLGTDEWSRTLLDTVLTCELPLVVDADALNLLAHAGVSRKNWVLTPHPGEAGRLLAKPTAAIQDDRLGSLQTIVDRYQGVVVLKGAGTLVSSAAGAPWICSAGNPGMAAPGMGDALTGIVAALCAQGLSLEMAAIVGVQIHAEAGDAAAAQGERGLLVTDLLAALRAIVNP
ncbi:MAG: NAD(P)H-hydrate dehydratase [Woeseia sp.]|nr:NAD(P)H-hydrate dehydratase [Woeseia sp.]